MCFVETLGNDDFQTLADGFLSRVPKYSCGRVVPADNIAGMICRNDRINRRFRNGAELLLCLFALTDVADNPCIVKDKEPLQLSNVKNLFFHPCIVSWVSGIKIHPRDVYSNSGHPGQVSLLFCIGGLYKLARNNVLK